MAKFPFKTHTGLVLDVDKDGDEYVLTLQGTNIKELKRGSFGEVMAEAQKVAKHYEERKAAES